MPKCNLAYNLRTNDPIADPTAEEYMRKVYGEFVGMKKAKRETAALEGKTEEDSDDDSVFGEGDTTEVVLSGNN